MALSKYKRKLQLSFTLKDERWQYQIDDLPDNGLCDKAGLIKTLTLVCNSTTQELSLTLSKIQPTRALSGQPLHLFIHFTCSAFRLQLDGATPATFRESSGYLVRLLTSGLSLNGMKYHFYGHSNSQLKSKSCILMAGSKESVCRHVESLGDFTTMKTVAKKAKRIGLLFSTAHSVLDVDATRCKDIEDIESEGYTFTDGCGLMSPALSRVLAQKLPITYRNRRYHPSVFQIRYRGYKGVVSIEPRMARGTWLELRKSMRKFRGTGDMSFAVIEYSRVSFCKLLDDASLTFLQSHIPLAI